MAQSADGQTDGAATDSTTPGGEAAAEDSLKQKTDSAASDPHRREYYLAQIPFTPEQVQASDAIIMDGLCQAGIIFNESKMVPVFPYNIAKAAGQKDARAQ